MTARPSADRLRAAAFGLMIACGAPPGGGSSVTAPVAPPDAAPGVAEAWRALIAEAGPALEACAQGPFAGLVPERVGTAPLPFDRAAVDAACGDAGALFDRHRDLLGRDRGLDSFLAQFARVGDDLDYVRRALDRPDPVERDRAVDHVLGALARARDAIAEPLEPGRYDEPVPADAAEWRRIVLRDERVRANLGRFLRQLGLNQGRRELVRERMLTAAFTAALADLEGREQGLGAAELDPAERAAREAWHGVTAAARRELHDVARACIAGEAVEPAAREVLRSRVETAEARAAEAQAVELARLGP